MSRVLVLNCGSATIKYRFVESGLIETREYEDALTQLFDRLDLTGLEAVGHRVVHGGTRFTEPTLIDDDVVAAIRDLVPLAPLHNPANVTGIEVARAKLPDVPHVAVFDTAFHHTLPPYAANYAIDTGMAERFGVRRYGFHGTSYAYVSRQTAFLLGRPYGTVNTITLHLGNGASACAVAGGRSVATSMGMSPLEGLVMGTRSGDIDPAVVFHLSRTGGMSLDDIDKLLDKQSGLLGLCGASDMREVLSRTDSAARLALDMYCHRIRQYVGAYYAVLGRVDAVTFTGGVGEHAAQVRAASLEGLDRLGIAVDQDRNRRNDPIISPDRAGVTVCVVPTDEEQEIATQTRQVVGLA